MPSARSLEISPRSILLILAAIAGVWLAYELWILELILIMALILAGTFNPPIEWLEQRGIRRNYALALLCAALTVVAALLLVLTIPALIAQLTDLLQNAPAMRARLIDWLSERRVTMPFAHAVQGVGIDQALTRVEGYFVGFSPSAARTVGYSMTTIVLAFYLLADGKRTQGVAFSVVPRAYHMRLARILQNMERIVGGYMRGQLITSVAMGVFTFVLLLVCHVPNALSLALFAAVVDVIPFIGGLLVIIPAVLSALPRGLPVAGVVLVALSVYMEFESRILIPKIYGKVLRLPPTVIILALIAGALLLGIVGALLALPIAAGVLMVLEELRVEMPGDDRVDPAERQRDAQAEATYERMSAGAAAPEAGQIARHLAHEIRDAGLAETPKS